MGLLLDAAGPLAGQLESLPSVLLYFGGLVVFLIISVILNVLKQLLFRNPREPPVVFHWFPFIGNTISYGIEPFEFFQASREKYGDVFTFILLGRKTTVALGPKGNNLILNGKLKDLNAEEVYGPIVTPIFGKDVIYDCPNSKLMEQKKFIKFGLTTEAFRSYVTLITAEVEDFVKKSPHFKHDHGIINVGPTMAELTIFTASRSLQGREVREKFDTSFASYYHDLDMGLKPINLIFPRAPIHSNRLRDAAHKKMADTYTSVIQQRRVATEKGKPDEGDMIANLMKCKYKDGRQLPDQEIANMMIALLMAGQHSSSSTITWVVLRLASRPDITEDLLQEQKNVFGEDLPPLTYENLSQLPLHAQVIKETLRLHAPIHSIMRKVTSSLPVEGESFVIPKGHVVIAAPGVSARQPEYFPNPMNWEPHRWDNNKLGEDDEERVDYGWGLISKGANSPYLPFGAGRHRCIGEQFAYLQLQTILALLVRSFRFRNLDGSRDVVPTDFSSMFTRAINPANIEYSRRK